MSIRLSATKIRVLVTVALPLIAAGCGTTDRIKASSIPIEDYRVRHPIVLAEARTSIDIFPSRGIERLDLHTSKQILAFAHQYRETGQGPVLVLLPRGRASGGSGVVARIRQALVEGGVRGGVDVSTYPVTDPGLASPVRLSFNGIKARVADQCGQWPTDLASGSSVEGWENKPYWNLGCATQSVIAAQTADPRDLVTPRGEDQSDAIIRARGIDTIRKGTDPATDWRVKGSSIVAVGGT